MQNNTFDFGRELGQTERLFFLDVCVLCSCVRGRDGEMAKVARQAEMDKTDGALL